MILKYKKLMLVVIFIYPTIVFSESPGSWRDKETFGLGFGIEGIGGGGFFDIAINSTLQIHIFGSSSSEEAKALVGSDGAITSRSISGASLRIFPSDDYGFFIGFGGGGISINQTVKQTTYSNYYDYTGTTKETVSEASGSVSFSEFGWQGYDGYYFTIGARGGSINISDEVDNTDKVTDTSNHKIVAKEQWENAKNSPGGLLLSFGCIFKLINPYH